MLMDTNEKPAETDLFKPESPAEDQDPQLQTSEVGSASWSASEFLQHQKTAVWYLAACGAILVLALLSYLFTRDLFGPVSVAVLGALLLVGAGRKPRTIQYTVDAHGVVIGNKEYAYDDFQSFAVMQEGQIESIALFPQKRFAPEINMYFVPDDGQKIFDILSKFLPFEQREKDRIDKFLHKIKF